METSELVKQIKRSFRLFMNGVTAASMRQKGLEYKVNWGVSQPDLRRMAMQYDKDSALAQALWNEKGVRECRLLATLIMPSDKMSEDMALQWANDITSAELAEMLAFNLFQYLPFGYTLVRQMLDKDNVSRICAYNLMCRLMKRGITRYRHIRQTVVGNFGRHTFCRPTVVAFASQLPAIHRADQHRKGI